MCLASASPVSRLPGLKHCRALDGRAGTSQRMSLRLGTWLGTDHCKDEHTTVTTWGGLGPAKTNHKGA